MDHTRLRRVLLGSVMGAALLSSPVLIPASLNPFAPATAEAAVSVKFSIFFSDLQPYGRWVHNADYNYVWVPTHVDRKWAPYTHGHWVYTDRYGWYFESDEPFAPIVYHYGRWGYEPALGWYWVPGTTWAPAWVAWRRGDRYVGWAPLPPENNGYSTGVNITINIGAIPRDHWYFVRAPRFLDRDLADVVVRGDRHDDVYRDSRPLGPVAIQNDIVVNALINLDFIQKSTGKHVERHRVKEVEDPKAAAKNGGKGDIPAFIADISQPRDQDKPEKAAEQKEVEKSPPPTSGTLAAQTPPETSNGAAENKQPCVDTDPKKDGCQPAKAAEGQKRPQPPTAENQAEQPQNSQQPKSAANPPQQNRNGQEDHGQPTGAAANGGPGKADCPDDANPQRPGCQQAEKAPQGTPAQQQGTNDRSAPPADVTGSVGKQLERSCPNDADPQKPGCQRAESNPSQKPDTQGMLREDKAPKQGSEKQGLDRAANAKRDCRVDADPQEPGCQVPHQD